MGARPWVLSSPQQVGGKTEAKGDWSWPRSAFRPEGRERRRKRRCGMTRPKQSGAGIGGRQGGGGTTETSRPTARKLAAVPHVSRWTYVGGHNRLNSALVHGARLWGVYCWPQSNIGRKCVQACAGRVHLVFEGSGSWCGPV
jgi:hypothetical protein